MKNNLLLIFILFTNFAFSQSNFKWAEEGANWHFGNRDPIWSNGYYHFWYQSDTTINGVQCQKIKSETEYNWQTSPTTFEFSGMLNGIDFYVYKNGNEVYRKGNDDIFYLYFKTEASINDIWNLGNGFYCRVDSISEFQHNNQTLKDFFVTNCDSVGNTIILTIFEPIIFGPDTVYQVAKGRVNSLFGPLSGFRGSLVRYPPNPEFGNVLDYFLCYESNITPIFKYSTLTDCKNGIYLSISEIETSNKNIKIYPNPSESILMIEFDENKIKNKIDFTIYNKLGAKIKSGKITSKVIDVFNMESGIYFLEIDNIYTKFIKQ